RLQALKFPEDQLTVAAPLPYPEYLKLMAGHRLVVHVRLSSLPGQAAGDNLISRIPTAGGNGGAEDVAFPAVPGMGRTLDQLTELTWQLMHDDHFYREQLGALGTIAAEHLSFAKGLESLARWLPGLT